MTDVIIRSVLSILMISYFITLSGNNIVLVHDVASYIASSSSFHVASFLFLIKFLINYNFM